MRCKRLCADSVADSLADERASGYGDGSRGQAGRSASPGGPPLSARPSVPLSTAVNIRQLTDVLAMQIASEFAPKRGRRMRRRHDAGPVKSRSEMAGKDDISHGAQRVAVHLHDPMHEHAIAPPSSRLARFASFDALCGTSQEFITKNQVSATFSRRTSEDVSCRSVSREPLRELWAECFSRQQPSRPGARGDDPPRGPSPH